MRLSYAEYLHPKLNAVVQANQILFGILSNFFIEELIRHKYLYANYSLHIRISGKTKAASENA